MDESPTSEILNPCFEDYSFEAYEKNQSCFTTWLIKENVFNPLIAYYFRIHALAINDDVTLNIVNKLIYDWYSPLKSLREGLESKDLLRTIEGLENMQKGCDYVNHQAKQIEERSINFIASYITLDNFLCFNGIFSFYRPDKGKSTFLWLYRKTGDIQDVIYPYAWDNKSKKFIIPEGWTAFLPEGNRPKDIFFDFFDDLIKIDTIKEPRLKFKNPILEILQNERTPDTFEHAYELVRFYKKTQEQNRSTEITSKSTIPKEKGRPRIERPREILLQSIEDIPKKGWVVCAKRSFKIMTVRFFYSEKSPTKKGYITNQALNKKFRNGQMADKALRWDAKNTKLKGFIVISESFLKKLRERFEKDPNHQESCKKLCESVQTRKDFLQFYIQDNRKPK